jgi:hypothetical protein
MGFFSMDVENAASVFVSCEYYHYNDEKTKTYQGPNACTITITIRKITVNEKNNNYQEPNTQH